MLFLGVLNAGVELSVGPDNDVSDREDVERKGEESGPGSCCASDEGAVFSVFRLVVDA